MVEYFVLPKSLLPSTDQIENQSQRPKKVAFITGITGQDGLYMTQFLLFRQCEYIYEVHGLIRKNSATLPILYSFQEFLESNKCTAQSLTLHTGDISDSLFMYQTIDKIRPDEIYNFAAQSHVQHSFTIAHHTIDINLNGLLNICQSVVQIKLDTRIFQASTSEMFGQIDSTRNTEGVLMDEEFPFNPASPYAVSKISAYFLVKYFRTVYKLKICTAFSFNHESPLRHELFITRKITKGIARIKHGLQQKIKLGNLYAVRDWGHTSDYVRGFWLMLNKQPNKEQYQDFVLATEVSISVKDFLLRVFKKAGFKDVKFVGEGSNEKLINNEGRVFVEIDQEYIRPGEVSFLKGTYKKIKQDIGWVPQISLEELINEMVEYDNLLAKNEADIKYRSKL